MMKNWTTRNASKLTWTASVALGFAAVEIGR
jgi:hypothetical protein